ncbi:hypothetical protein RCO28_38570 [Streptomyces sp. LHD-70]|uniref:hypothetical protein n=1 Tax=Streptomyces sp. LHD-70 TaxID=3072140 RepID=UPI00281010E3|nr:hypothetical protein [Streptomyces sp. LHD-70]MDQ8708322.1 hypothetical protein [Streptomyces sp. LHD-70]
MPLPTDRTALDLLDAHLEALQDALWEGMDLPSAQEPDRIAAAGGGELVGWALEQLRHIPSEPRHAYVRQVSDLLTEFRSRRCPWNAAALRLLDNAYPFVATGPRRCEAWAHDVRAVLHRSVPDPRGWVRLDGDRHNDARDIVPAYPFDPPDAAELPGRLYPLEAEAAVAALAIMTEQWRLEPAPVRSRPDRDAVLADARTLLDRYGPTARYWTNATAAASDPSPDFIAAGLQSTESQCSFLTSEYLNGLDLFGGLGLIVVSDEEVGVFWSILAY